MNKYLSYYVIIVVSADDEKGLSIMETVIVNGGLRQSGSGMGGLPG